MLRLRPRAADLAQHDRAGEWGWMAWRSERRTKTQQPRRMPRLRAAANNERAYLVCPAATGVGVGVGVDAAGAAAGFWSGLRMSIPPLKKAPSSMLIRAAATSPVRAPSARMSTRSVAVTLPRTLPRTTTSRAVMLAATWPLRPTVTRLPLRLMLPSTFPSMNNDSEPVISPLMNRPLLMEAWSAAAATPARLADSIGDAAGAAGRTGSGGACGGDGGSGWLGFHIQCSRFLSLSASGFGSLAGRVSIDRNCGNSNRPFRFPRPQRELGTRDRGVG